MREEEREEEHRRRRKGIVGEMKTGEQGKANPLSPRIGESSEIAAL